MASSHVSLIFVLVACIVALPVHSTKFDVGDQEGWKVPSSEDPQIYNHWASNNRFQVGDIVRFEYEKDSVMEVTEKEYESCESDRPIFFSNNGKTEFRFESSGTFYFISGVSGHCERGQKMIVKVMGDSPPPPSRAGPLLATTPLQLLSLFAATIFF